MSQNQIIAIVSALVIIVAIIGRAVTRRGGLEATSQPPQPAPSSGELHSRSSPNAAAGVDLGVEVHGDEKPNSSMLFALLPTGGANVPVSLRALRAQIDRAPSSLHKSRAKLARAGAPLPPRQRSRGGKSRHLAPTSSVTRPRQSPASRRVTTERCKHSPSHQLQALAALLPHHWRSAPHCDADPSPNG